MLRRRVARLTRQNGVARILVADDNRDAANSLTLLLQLEGHDVRTAYDGREALDIARQLKPQIAILDLNMPWLTGLEVAHLLRAESWGAKTAIIALTAIDDDQTRLHAAAVGINLFFRKPFDPVTFDRALQTVLAGIDTV